MAVEVRRTDESIEVRSPAPRIRWQSLVVLSWLPFITAGGVAVYVTATSFPLMVARGGAMWLAGVFFVGFSLIVFLGCIAGMISSLYGLAGTERVHADAAGIVMYHELWGLRLASRFPPHRIRNVRVSIPAEGSVWSPTGPRVVFDTPGRVQGFGAALSPEQAAEVAGTISELLDASPSGEGDRA